MWLLIWKGIPEKLFNKKSSVEKHLNKDGTTLKKVKEDMENNPMPNTEVYEIEDPTD